MTNIFGSFGPRHKRLPKFVQRVTDICFGAVAAHHQFYSAGSKAARHVGETFRKRLQAGETLYVIGITPMGHNTGVAVVSVSNAGGIEVLCNNEEERFTGEKHTNKFPHESLREVRELLQARGIPAEQVFTVGGWDYVSALGFDLRVIFEHAPRSLTLLNPKHDPTFNPTHLVRGVKAPSNISHALGSSQTLPFIGMHHHKNHAYLGYSLSPFSETDDDVMITVLDGTGDNGAISLYHAKAGEVTCLRQNESTTDSLGYLYGYISSTQGGWSFLSSEGRYMGAAAWGNSCRVTNSYYKRLRQILYFGAAGEVHVNRAMINWHIKSHTDPYGPSLTDILGPAIKPEKTWNPDRVLSVEDIEHSPITQDRVDKAQALQLVFEDGLFHIVEHLIRKTGASKLVLTGGTALNCVATMRLTEHFNRDYFRRYLNKDATLEVWVPPIPNDAGVALGAAIHFAAENGARPRSRLETPYICGRAAPTAEIQNACAQASVKADYIGNIKQKSVLMQLAEFMADIVSQDGVVGLYQGAAETGPRALGNRSILANPRNVKTLENLNDKVKFRERVRPLAPMVTREQADKYFELSEGCAARDFDAYNYMVLTTRAKPVAKREIPAVVHADGTSRIQIVRRTDNELVYEYLNAMGRLNGAEVSVNTSLNVGSPIAQTAAQALETLRRAKGMDYLVMVSKEGDAFCVPGATRKGRTTSFQDASRRDDRVEVLAKER